MDEISKYIAVYALSGLKFIAGPLLGIGSGMNFMLTAILTSMGMMTSVYFFSTLIGSKFRDWLLKTFYKNRRLFSKRNRKKIIIWRKYGLKGVAFLTPVLFSPIGGTLLASSFGESRKRIFMYMMVSSLFWSFIFSSVLHYFKHIQ